MTQQVLRLAEKINDQYLTCKICLEAFKEPKCLSCLHTFCEECIESHVSAQRSYKYSDYREFACPICRKKTSIPSGGVHKLPSNFLIAGLSEMITERSAGASNAIRVLTYCEICKAIYEREREASSRCLECQKFLCRSCVQAHQNITVTRNHSIYELEIEKDIVCKYHPSEFVRYYCDECQMCICLACTYVDHRDHQLTDFRTAAANHKATVFQCLDNCRSRMNELESYMNVIRQCDVNMAQIESSIHALASTFDKSLRIKEQELVKEISQLYGEESEEFVKRRDELDEFYEQIKNTCALTELVIHGRDIEFLLVKKQLLEKFDQLQSIELEPLPANLHLHIKFQPGRLNLGKLTISERTPTDDDECDGEVEEEQEDLRVKRPRIHPSVSIATQTDPIVIASQSVQTVDDSLYDDQSLCDELERRCSLHLDEVPSTENVYEESNKLSRRIRRLLKPTCGVTVLPNTDVMILDCEQNLASILDKRGKFKYCFTSDLHKDEHKSFLAPSSTSTTNNLTLAMGNSRSVRIATQQGLLTIKLKNDRQNQLPVALTVHAFNSISEKDN